ncbi:Threonine--tRNA ligase [Nymphon striatum]|nr:Threonine--tRNA ligase [Nymphon striatum]
MEPGWQLLIHPMPLKKSLKILMPWLKSLRHLKSTTRVRLRDWIQRIPPKMAQISLSFPDGSKREFQAGVTGLEVAESIAKSLAKRSVAYALDGELRDLTDPIETNGALELVARSDDRALELIRHDCAHVLAEAVQEIWPGTQVTIGPVIENGFYYDFAKDEPFTPEDLPTLKIYKQGEWLDLCRGPHMRSTKDIGTAFKLMSVAGAYWRGDSNNAMLTRIYGTAWADEKQLKQYMFMREEAEKRDHRKLGREMDLFHFQEEGPGVVFWHSKGWRVFQSLVNYMRRRLEGTYEEVNAPQILDKSLWETSGHWGWYNENMFAVKSAHALTNPDDEEADHRVFAIKPMNCPGHVQIFKHGLRSYREMPVRLAEFGNILGLKKCRCFYPLVPEKRVGDDASWDHAEEIMTDVLKTIEEQSGGKIKTGINEGEGAFYGPKFEYTLKDAIGRTWQCGTTQVDFNLPERFGAFYIDSDSNKKQPVMIHRAICGSMERFLGILIENFAGHFPLWLAPQQVVVATITTEANEYAEEVAAKLKKAGLQAKVDTRNEKINYKVREHSLAKVPVIMVCGMREAEEGSVNIRRLGSKDQTSMSLDDAITSLVEEATPPDLR